MEVVGRPGQSPNLDEIQLIGVRAFCSSRPTPRAQTPKKGNGRAIRRGRGGKERWSWSRRCTGRGSGRLSAADRHLRHREQGAVQVLSCYSNGKGQSLQAKVCTRTDPTSISGLYLVKLLATRGKGSMAWVTCVDVRRHDRMECPLLHLGHTASPHVERYVRRIPHALACARWLTKPHT